MLERKGEEPEYGCKTTYPRRGLKPLGGVLGLPLAPLQNHLSSKRIETHLDTRGRTPPEVAKPLILEED